jgi:SAM-dependent MidA family methyltransferase
MDYYICVNALEKMIVNRIREEGEITFSEFMRMALYTPELGYYTSRDTEIGVSGDFYTSPHLHPVFGALIGRQAEQMWELMGRPPAFDLVEIGGGRGYLCKDMLDYLSGREIYASISCTIVEKNPHMAERQRDLLSGHGETVRWAGSAGELEDIRGCVLSNEVLDAMPVHIVLMEDELKEVYVTLDGDRIAETVGPLSDPALAGYFDEFNIVLPEGYRTEINLALRDWIEEVSHMLSRGFLLTIDYGHAACEYYGEERDRGTLLCYHMHRAGENPYANVGGQDITAHANFSALKKWGESLGLRCVGYCRQGPFLVSLGIDEMMAELHEGPSASGLETARIKGLILPGGMGDSHKVMVQYRGEDEPDLRGFGISNRMGRL